MYICAPFKCSQCNGTAALISERDLLRAEVERLRSDRDCEKRLRKDADEFRENAIARAERAEAAETVALAQWNGALERAMKAEAERDLLRDSLALEQDMGNAAYDELRGDADELRADVVRLTARAEHAEAEVERLRSDRDCEKRLRKDAEELREDAIARAEKAERAEASLHAMRLVCGTTDADKFSTWVDRANARAERAEAEVEAYKKTLAELTRLNTKYIADQLNWDWQRQRDEARAELITRAGEIQTLAEELATERARLRQVALDACKSALIKPMVWSPSGYFMNPKDLGKINEQQVEACVAAIDAAMKEDAK